MSRTVDQPASEIVQALQGHHREAMLDLILEWAKIDGALGWFLSAIHGFDPVDGATLIEGMKVGQIFQDARKVIRKSPGGDEAANKLKKMKRTYERYAPIRNLIAHSSCAGVDAGDPDRIVFLIFSAEDRGLAAESVPLSDILLATQYARALTAFLFQAAGLPIH